VLVAEPTVYGDKRIEFLERLDVTENEAVANPRDSLTGYLFNGVPFSAHGP
jgi:hypothetical protein